MHQASGIPQMQACVCLLLSWRSPNMPHQQVCLRLVQLVAISYYGGHAAAGVSGTTLCLDHCQLLGAR